MTNTEIIARNTEALIKKGIIEEDDMIHTYQGWQRLGMQVRKGEKAIAKIQIWKRGKGRPTKMKNAATGEESEVIPERFFLTNASFFSSRQVEAIGA